MTIRTLRTLLICTACLQLPVLARAQNYMFSTIAGWPQSGAPLADGDGYRNYARFYYPYSAAVDSAGNVFITDTFKHTIRKITPAHDVTTFAGGGTSGLVDGNGRDARFNYPWGLAIDSANNLYVTDAGAVRKVTPSGDVTTVAGNGTLGSADGTGSDARFNWASGVAVDGAGTIYVADQHNHAIRRVTQGGVVTTLAGQLGASGTTDGFGAGARFNQPIGIAVDSSGTVYVADTWNHTIRKVTPGGMVTTWAGFAGLHGAADGTGAAARFFRPQGLAIDSADRLLVADTENNRIRRVTSDGAVTTVAGLDPLDDDGPSAVVRFRRPHGLAVAASGVLYVVDTDNHTIRSGVPTPGPVWPFMRLAGSYQGSSGSNDGVWCTGCPGADAYGPASSARFLQPADVTADSAGVAFVADQGNATIRRISATGTVTTLAGLAGVFGSTDGTGSGARFNAPGAVATSNGVIYVADTGNHTIRRVTSAGVVTTLAGLASSPGSGDGNGSLARFNAPNGLAVDGAGAVYVADTNNGTIRRLTPSGDVTTLAGLAGVFGSTDGTGAAARFNFPRGVAVDGAGSLYVADTGNHTIRKISAAGVVTTLAGLAGVSGARDGTGSAARFHSPRDVAVTSAGVVYVADEQNHQIRTISPAGVVTTVAGGPGVTGLVNGYGLTARFGAPSGIAVDTAGTLYTVDPTFHNIRRQGPSPSGAEIAANGTFADGTTAWAQFALPGPSAMVSDISGGVFRFYRLPPGPGETTQAVVFQNTGVPFVANAAITGRFDLGNSSGVRKRISILIHDSDFSDLAVCTFWLPANSALTTYTMRTHTTRPWTNATVSFYAASTGSNGGYYLLDNVSVQYASIDGSGNPVSTTETRCIDPLAPGAPGGAAGSNLLLNGDFSSGALPPWGTFGTVTASLSGNVLQFVRPSNVPPAGVVLQNTGQAMVANQILTATFQLGNSSGVTKRVTVILHDNDFSDLSACTFWLAPGQPLSTYTYRTFTTEAWTNATLSIYPATTGAEPWILFDNASLQRTPGAAISGTHCEEPSGGSDVVHPLSAQSPRFPIAASVDRGVPARPETSAEQAAKSLQLAASATWSSDGFVQASDHVWLALGLAPGRRTLELSEPLDFSTGSASPLVLHSLLHAQNSQAIVQISPDGIGWTTILSVTPSAGGERIRVDLSDVGDRPVRVRFVFDTVAAPDDEAADLWRIDLREFVRDPIVK